MEILKAVGLKKYYIEETYEVHALDGVSISAKEGEKRISICIFKELLFTAVSAAPDRSYSMNNVFAWQVVSAGNLCFSRLTTVQRSAFSQKCRDIWINFTFLFIRLCIVNTLSILLRKKMKDK